MATYNSNKLFLASKIALIATAMTFAIRANLIGEIGDEFLITPKHMGIIFGTAFWGFTLSIVIGGSLCAYLGLKNLLKLAFAAHITGILLTIFSTGFWSLFGSTLLVGIANGFVEAACNPLVANLFPDDKTKRLNQFHVWFPGGIVIGGLAAYVMTYYGFNWQVQTAIILIPTLIYGFLFLKEPLPQLATTDQHQSSNLKMLKSCVSPLFFILVICMLLTAATELGTNQWITELLSNTRVSAILLLVFINGLMAIGRSFAGTFEKLLSPAGMLLFSAFFTTVGLILLSSVTGYLLFGAATVFAIGICFFWPTMLGFVSEYLPETGAIGLSIMGGAGMLSVAVVLPFIGDVYAIHGGIITLRYVAILPAFLVVVFGLLVIFKSKYQHEK